MKIIAFGHRQDVGKSSAARFLTTELRLTRKGIDIQQCGFADKVKDIAYQLYNWAGLYPGSYYDDPDHYPLKNVVLEKINRTPRQLWIGIGNGLRQQAHPDTWLDYLFKNPKAHIMIISDLRFPNEADGILANGGAVIKIVRDSAKVVTDGADDPLESYDKWTEVIDNNGSLNDLHRKVMKIMKEHL